MRVWAAVLLSQLMAHAAANVTDSTTDDGSGFVRRLPRALIIGVKKGGTRALLAFIRLHPDVQAPGPEVHYFDRNYRRGLRWYRNRMPASLPTQLTMEKTPSYFVDPLAPSRVRAMDPGTRLVLLVRDPVARALSDYAQALDNARRRGAAVPPSFEQLAFLRDSSTVDANWTAMRIGRYADHLARWLAAFPRGQILVLSAERLVSDPGAVLERLQGFLGLQVLVNRRHFYYDRRKGFHCLKKTWGGGRQRCLARDKGRRHPSLAPERLRQLRAYYRQHNRRFYRLAGEDFGWA